MPHGYIRIDVVGKYRHPSQEDSFDRAVKLKCKIPTESGVFVQSGGERKIADFLFEHEIPFEYDRLIKFGEEEDPDTNLWARPDFRIKGKNIIIEYWGMKYDRADNPNYDERALKKIEIYKQEDFTLIEVFTEQLEFIETYLTRELIQVGVM